MGRCILIRSTFAAFASHYKLDNLVGIIDVNRLGQSEATALGHDVDTYARRMAAFGWEAIIVDGHDVADISRALAKARATKGRPTALIAKTLKGKGITGIEDQLDWHGKPVGDKHLQEIRARLKNTGPIKLCVPPAPHDVPMVKMAPPSLDTPPAYKLGEKVVHDSYSNARRWRRVPRTAWHWPNWATPARRSSPWTATPRTARSPRRSRRRTPTDSSSASSPSRIWSAWPSAVRRAIARFRSAGARLLIRKL